jgi:4-hydroxybenzoate polyprenyltransferase
MSGGAAMAAPYKFLSWLALYTATTLTYSMYLKRKLLLDVFVLSGLYTVRILAGSAATGVPVSAWLAGFSVFFFLSLAFVKRFSELEGLRERGSAVSNGRGYFVSDIEQLRALGTGAAYAAVVVLTLYINDWKTGTLYVHPVRLWLAVPVLLLWLSQIWMLTSRGEMHDDPVVFAITDKRSLWMGVLMAVVIWWAL